MNIKQLITFLQEQPEDAKLLTYNIFSEEHGSINKVKVYKTPEDIEYDKGGKPKIKKGETIVVIGSFYN